MLQSAATFFDAGIGTMQSLFLSALIEIEDISSVRSYVGSLDLMKKHLKRWKSRVRLQGLMRTYGP